MKGLSQKQKLYFFALPIVILVLTGIAITAFLSVGLVMRGLREGAVADVFVGVVIAALWLLMAFKTITGRRQATATR